MVIVGIDDGAVSALDVDHWGLEASTLHKLRHDEHDRFASFLRSHGASCGLADPVTVLETRSGEDGAFSFECEPASSEERARTLELYGWARSDLLDMVQGASEAELDWIDPDRRLPGWAWWRSAREMAWHCALTECFRYLGRLGVPLPTVLAGRTSPLPVPDTPSLVAALRSTREHVCRAIEAIPADLVIQVDEETWTTRKSLRRLAGHERGENFVTASLLLRAREAMDSTSPQGQP